MSVPPQGHSNADLSPYRILATCLDDDPVQILSDLSKYRSRIGSPAMTNKLDAWAYGDPAQKNTVRAYARQSLSYPDPPVSAD